ncbi:MAG: beta-N-acetylhexosaminidase [candidate division Zixibacteria bacterium]|nr:beta-N-acetylhexosaminidase [candidate division Zixibacteria bacterium]
MSSSLNIIPAPVSADRGSGSFTLSKSTAIALDRDRDLVKVLADYLKKQIESFFNIRLENSPRVNRDDRENVILLALEENKPGHTPEEYQLEVNEKRATIRAYNEAGLFYGIQTLIQLAEPDGADGFKIPGVFIEDRPRFDWRGMHLDVSRHFFDTNEIKKYIDLLALHKMNIFHWHLTDDQGWRVEIKKYPQLTDIGAWRIDKHGVKYGGFYTQEDIREIVAYAASRFVTVVPEIDIPGHTSAALAACPDYSCTGGSFEVPNRWGVFEDVLCPGKDETFVFVENVLSEICELFPGEYSHVGGDECPTVRWKKCPHCLARIKNERLCDENELQGYFMKRVEKILTARNKKMIGWDEILQSGLPRSAAVMAWRDTKYGLEAARTGHRVVMCPMSHCYFDFYQAKENEPRAIGGFLPLAKVYEFEPVPKGLNETESRRILGGQGNVWTEYMPVFKHVEYMAVPRLCALAEKLWSPGGKNDFENFIQRLEHHYRRLDRLSVNYRRY